MEIMSHRMKIICNYGAAWLTVPFCHSDLTETFYSKMVMRPSMTSPHPSS